MQSQRNFRYTRPFQNLDWESDLFHGGELDEKSRLYEFCKGNPNFSVKSSIFSPCFPFKNYPQKFVQEILNLSVRVGGRNTSIEEEWIDTWSKHIQSRSIQHEAFEILASHRIIDVAAAIQVDEHLRHKNSSGDITVPQIANHDILQAHAEVYGKIFKEKNGWKVSTILSSVKDSISCYLNNSNVKPADSGIASGHGHAAKLAMSAVKHRTKAEGAHILFNIEITAAHLHYNVQQVCPNNLLYF